MATLISDHEGCKYLRPIESAQTPGSLVYAAAAVSRAIELERGRLAAAEMEGSEL